VSEPLVRDAIADDWDMIARLFSSMGFVTDRGDLAARMERLDNTNGHLLVAIVNNRPVGCIGTSLMAAPHRDAPVGRISVLVVDEASRGLGVGKALVGAAEALLRDQGCGLIEVTSRFELVEAHDFYEALGYAKTSVRLARQL